MYKLKTTLPTQITNLTEAKKYLTDLHSNRESYHPDDPAEDCFAGISAQVANNMNELLDQVFKFFNEANEDVYFFILDLENAGNVYTTKNVEAIAAILKQSFANGLPEDKVVFQPVLYEAFKQITGIDFDPNDTDHYRLRNDAYNEAK